MKFQIEVLNVVVSSHPNNKGGTYQKLEVAYKNLTSGKIEAKKLVSFTNPDVFKVVVEAQPGNQLDVTAEKGEQFWEWKTVTAIAPGAQQNNSKTNAQGTASPRSTYETPEERAKKQVYIVRQSSITSAIATLSVGVKQPPDVNAVLKLAQEYVDFVFQVEAPSVASVEDDIPY